MSLWQSLYRWITRGRSPATETGADLHRRMAEVQKAHGSNVKSAKAVGVSEGTWRRWLKNEAVPKPENLAGLHRAQRRIRLTPGREARLVGGKDPGLKRMKVDATVKVSEDERERTGLQPGPYFTDASMRDIMRAYLSGDNEALEAAFITALETDYIPGSQFTNVKITKF